MSKYIDSKAAYELARTNEYYSDFRRSTADLTSLKELLDDTPSADVVEVVRCKDCEYCCFTIDPKTNIGFQKCGYIGYNPVQSSQVSDNDFCSHGERRVEE